MTPPRLTAAAFLAIGANCDTVPVTRSSNREPTAITTSASYPEQLLNGVSQPKRNRKRFSDDSDGNHW